MNISNVRNVMLLGHSSAGKTTLCDALLVKMGITEQAGSVANGTSFSDWTEEEISRKISVYVHPYVGTPKIKGDASAMKLVIMDTPGVDDFIGQRVAAGAVSDSALLVIDAAGGLLIGSYKAWQYCIENRKPRGIVITGLDKENVSFEKVLNDIQAIWGKLCVPFTVIINGKVENVLNSSENTLIDYKNAIIEKAAETDDKLIEKYLNGEALSNEEVQKGMKSAVLSGALVPIFAVIATKDVGLNELLDGIYNLFPAPSDIPLKDGKGKKIEVSSEGQLLAYVWRNVTDPFAGKLSYVRIYSGVLKEAVEVINVSKNSKEKIGAILQPSGKKAVPITEAHVGDIVALPKLKNVSVGDVLSSSSTPIHLASIPFPSPVVWMAVVPKNQADEDKISTALNRIVEDDPTLHIERIQETREFVLSGMGDAQLEVVRELIKKRAGIDIEFKVPKVVYRETCTGLGDGHYKHKKQSGGRGQYAEVYCKVQPRQSDDEEWFVDAIVGGVIPKNFLPACQKGFLEAMQHGVLAGFPVVNIKTTVYDGSYHEVDSSEIAFKIAAARALKDALQKAKPVLLEPIMTLKVSIPDHFMGDVNGDLNHKRGRIMGVDVENGLQVITAEAPQAEMFRYCSELRSMTGGRGSFEMKFARYDIVPSNIAQKVIAAAEKVKEEEE
jgi:elongation factor G